ncbi:N-acetyltransferase [Staphylococcus sp. HKU1]|uniref:GNAT family N-acetyltransferase n=1 Tax=unclassified Staphylococcus TaxID=91994 RepID=UPI00204232E3|nr:N-acetyltransferase [Staphylococcus sp. Marseille-Q6910]
MQVYLSSITENDYDLSLDAIKKAFEDVEMSNHDEQDLVVKLREAPEYNYELEVVAKNEDGDVIGHVMLSEITIVNDTKEYIALALAPLSVLPDYRGKGLGKALVNAVEDRVKSLEYTTIVVQGDPDYYEPLGYKEAAKYDIYSTFDVPSKYVMVKFLYEQLDDRPHGKIIYPDSFK